MKLLKSAFVGGLLITSGALILGSTIAVVIKRNKKLSASLKIYNSKKIKVLQLNNLIL